LCRQRFALAQYLCLFVCLFVCLWGTQENQTWVRDPGRGYPFKTRVLLCALKPLSISGFNRFNGWHNA
jgi:hypothetical protein